MLPLIKDVYIRYNSRVCTRDTDRIAKWPIIIGTVCIVSRDAINEIISFLILKKKRTSDCQISFSYHLDDKNTLLLFSGMY